MKKIIYGFIIASSILLSSSTQAWEQGDFLDDTFRQTNPSSGTIIEALYGTSTNLITSYSKNWDGYTGCIIPTENVQTVSSITEIPANTIYIIEAGDYVFTSQINFGQCSALLSSENTTLRMNIKLSLPYGLVQIDNNYSVVDGIILDGTAVNGERHDIGIRVHSNKNSFASLIIKNFEHGVYMDNGDYNSFYKIIAFNNLLDEDDGNGLSIKENSDYNTFDNIVSFNNGNGIYFNKVFDPRDVTVGPSQNTVNNSFFFNNINTCAGILLGEKNVINNSLLFNCKTALGIRYSDDNVINNLQIYNSDYGLQILGSNNILNNIDSYQNGIGLLVDQTYTSDNNKFYGTFNLSRNDTADFCYVNDLYAPVWTCANTTTDLTGNPKVSPGLSSDTIATDLGWTAGVEEYSVFSNCARTVEPLVTDLNFYSSTNCDQKGKLNRNYITGDISFNLGFKTISQSQPYAIVGSTLQNTDKVIDQSGILIGGQDIYVDNITGQYEVAEFNVGGQQYLEDETFTLTKGKGYLVTVHRANYTNENAFFGVGTYGSLKTNDRTLSSNTETQENIYLVPFKSTEKWNVE